MTQWAEPRTVLKEGNELIGPFSALGHIWFGTPFTGALDAWTGATPLDTFKQNNSLLVEHLYASDSLL